MKTHRLLGRGAVSAVAAGAAVLLSAPAATPAASASPYCGITWGSTGKANGLSYSKGQLTNVRSGRHACFDRLVLDVGKAGRGVKYDVRYVSTMREDTTGTVIPLRGGAKLQIIARVPAYDGRYRTTYHPADTKEIVDTSGYSTFRQAAWAGSWEGQTTIGLGVRGRLPVRVTVIDGPGATSRLVVDVAHRW